jgi:site-specific recombinase XerD
MNSDKTIKELIADHLENMEAEDYVKKNKLFVIMRFVNWLVKNKIDVRAPRFADVLRYKEALIAENKTPTTINAYLAPVRGFFKYLENNAIYSNIVTGLKKEVDDRNFRKQYLKPAQVVDMLESIPTDKIAGLRDYAMINLMVCTGLRRVEVLRLTVADVSEYDGNIVLNVRRKGRKYKEPIRIEEEVFTPIQSYLVKRNAYTNDAPLFANHSNHRDESLSEVMVSFIVKKYLKNINNSKMLTCHSLRHSAAINLLMSGKSIYDVKELLGHKSLETTQLYLKAIEAERRFNNPVARDLVNLYRNAAKTINKAKIPA